MRPDDLSWLDNEESLVRWHNRTLDEECAAYLAAHGAEMIEELAAAAQEDAAEE